MRVDALALGAGSVVTGLGLTWAFLALVTPDGDGEVESEQGSVEEVGPAFQALMFFAWCVLCVPCCLFGGVLMMYGAYHEINVPGLSKLDPLGMTCQLKDVEVAKLV